jgi:hypothetical protein
MVASGVRYLAGFLSAKLLDSFGFGFEASWVITEILRNASIDQFAVLTRCCSAQRIATA